MADPDILITKRKSVNPHRGPIKGKYSQERPIRRLANDKRLLQLLLGDIRESLKIILVLQRGGYGFDFIQRDHVDGTAPPPGARDPATQRPGLACDLADIVDFGTAAVVVPGAGGLGFVEELAEVFDVVLVEFVAGMGEAGFEV